MVQQTHIFKCMQERKGKQIISVFSHKLTFEWTKMMKKCHQHFDIICMTLFDLLLLIWFEFKQFIGIDYLYFYENRIVSPPLEVIKIVFNSKNILYESNSSCSHKYLKYFSVFDKNVALIRSHIGCL